MATGSLRVTLLRSSLLVKYGENVIKNCSVFTSLPNLSFLRAQEGQMRRYSSDNTATKVKQQTNISTEPLLISDNCVQKLKAILSENEFLRISVDGGGCSGFQYTFALDTNLNESEDCLIVKDGVRVVVDDISLEYVKEATVDYNQEMIRSSFRIISNPRAEQGCSCGASFAVKL